LKNLFNKSILESLYIQLHSTEPLNIFSKKKRDNGCTLLYTVPGEAAGKGEEGAGAASAGDGDSGAAAAGDAAGTLSLLPPGVPRLAPDPPRIPPRPDVREGFATRGFGSGSATSKQHMNGGQGVAKTDSILRPDPAFSTDKLPYPISDTFELFLFFKS
jgi:hypothetical protein